MFNINYFNRLLTERGWEKMCLRKRLLFDSPSLHHSVSCVESTDDASASCGILPMGLRVEPVLWYVIFHEREHYRPTCLIPHCARCIIHHPGHYSS